MANILVLGSTSHGALANSCSMALERLGHSVRMLDCNHFDPTWTSEEGLRLKEELHEEFVANYIAAIEEEIRRFAIQMVFEFDAPLLNEQTRANIKASGTPLYCFLPKGNPSSAAYSGVFSSESIPAYSGNDVLKPEAKAAYDQLMLKALHRLSIEPLTP